MSYFQGDPECAARIHVQAVGSPLRYILPVNYAGRYRVGVWQGCGKIKLLKEIKKPAYPDLIKVCHLPWFIFKGYPGCAGWIASLYDPPRYFVTLNYKPYYYFVNNLPAVQAIIFFDARKKWQKWVLGHGRGPGRKTYSPVGILFSRLPAGHLKSHFSHFTSDTSCPGIDADTQGSPSRHRIRHLCSVQRPPMAPMSRPPNLPDFDTSEPQFFRNRRRWVCHLENTFL